MIIVLEHGEEFAKRKIFVCEKCKCKFCANQCDCEDIYDGMFQFDVQLIRCPECGQEVGSWLEGE